MFNSESRQNHKLTNPELRDISDHAGVHLSLHLDKDTTWRLDTSLLNDPQYKKKH